MLNRHKVLLTTVFILALVAGPLLKGQDSHVRIVRVSYAEGVVKLNNQNVTLNMPLIEGNVLTTGSDSVAEVQFEDGSTMRLSPETQVTLSQLSRLNSGEAVTRADLDQGEAEFTIASRSAGRFGAYAHNKSILFKRPGRFRVLSTNSDPLELAVWKGEAAVHDPDTGTDVDVKTSETFTLAADDPQQYDLEKGIDADDLDRWSLQRQQYLESNYVSVAGSNSVVSSPGFATFGFLNPCQQYYWLSYSWNSALPGYCFSSNYYDPSPPYGYVYYPGHYRPHHHPPHIHPPTPPAAAAAGRIGSGSAVVNARSANQTPHRPVLRELNDLNLPRNTPVVDGREAKNQKGAKGGDRAGVEVHGSSNNSGHAGRGDSGHSGQSQHSAAGNSYSSHASSSSPSGSHSYSGSSSASFSHSSGSFSSSSSSAGAASHSSSSSSSSSGSSGGGRGR